MRNNQKSEEEYDEDDLFKITPYIFEDGVLNL